MASTRLSPIRLSMQIAPCPGAGGNFSSGIRSVATLCSPSRFSPASARIVPSATPSCSLRSRVCDIAAEGHDLEVRPHAAGSAPAGAATRSRLSRRAGRSMIDFAVRPMKASRGSSRGRKAESTRPSGSTVGMSFEECTAMSMRPASSASSISLVNRPLPPASDSGRSWMRSPLVVIDLDREGVFRQVVRRHQPGARLVRLRQRQRAAARSDPQHGCLHGAVRDTPA